MEQLSAGQKEIKAVFNISSRNNPLYVDVNQSLLQELLNDGNNQQNQLFFSLQDFAATIKMRTGVETSNSELIGTDEQFNFRDSSGPDLLIAKPLLFQNKEIGIMVENLVGYYSNAKIQTELVECVYPEFLFSLQNKELLFRHIYNQITGFPIRLQNQIKISFIIRNYLNQQEDNVRSYRLVNFGENTYTIVFALY